MGFLFVWLVGFVCFLCSGQLVGWLVVGGGGGVFGLFLFSFVWGGGVFVWEWGGGRGRGSVELENTLKRRSKQPIIGSVSQQHLTDQRYVNLTSRPLRGSLNFNFPSQRSVRPTLARPGLPGVSPQSEGSDDLCSTRTANTGTDTRAVTICVQPARPTLVLTPGQ